MCEYSSFYPAVANLPRQRERLVEVSERFLRIVQKVVNVSHVGERYGLDPAITYRTR